MSVPRQTHIRSPSAPVFPKYAGKLFLDTLLPSDSDSSNGVGLTGACVQLTHEAFEQFFLRTLNVLDGVIAGSTDFVYVATL